MSNFKQYSFEISYPDRQINHIRIKAGEFVRPDELLTAVNQHGKIKLHGIVDVSTEERVHDFYLIGTGGSIPEEIVDRLFHVQTLLLADGKFGYHLYGLKQEQETVAYKFVEITFQPDAEQEEIASYVSEVHDLVVNFSPAVRYESRNSTNIVLGFIDRSAKVERTGQFTDLRERFEDDESVVKSFHVYNA